MSQQQYDHLPPPPPPRSPNPHHPTGPPSSQHRRPVSMFVQPPTLTTNIARTLAAQQPASAHTLAPPGPHPFSPATPSALNPHSPGGLAVPASAVSPRTMEPYNPRQWSNRGQVSGTQMLFQQQRSSGLPANTREITGMEGAMPSPPPPYSQESPEPTSRGGLRASAPMLDTSVLTVSPVAGDSSVHNSPAVPMSPAFPPPPSSSSRHRERSTSGIGNSRGFFSLSGLRGKSTTNAELAASISVHVPESLEVRPPGARRAASTGHLGSTSNYVAAVTPVGSGAAGRGSPDNAWQPGMPLPGPPPGPPPPEQRSQSLNRCGQSTSRSNSLTSEHSLDAPQPRRAAATGSQLGPVPPTPADWVETDAIPPEFNAATADYPPLRIDTGSHQDSALTRRPARRDGSAQGLRERRSRSKAKDRNSRVFSPVSDDGRPDESLFDTAEGAISRRREHTRTLSGIAGPTSQANSPSPRGTGATSATLPNLASHVLTPPYTPGMTKANEETARKQPLQVPGSASSDRPVSHLLHQPIAESSAMPAPLTPSRPPSSSSAMAPAKLDAFFMQAIERHRAFVEKEAAAASDEERLELFANFMVHESRIRRDRYAAAYNAMAGDIMDLTRDMWRSYVRQGKRAPTPSTSMSSYDATVPSWASDEQPASAHPNMPSSASSFGDFTPGTDVASNYDSMDSAGADRPESRQWGETFKPSLSPIPSMAVSTVPDEGSERGRTASRWWEPSNSGSGSIGKPERIEKTHRETKYMGVSPAQFQESGQPSPPSSGYRGGTPGPSTQSSGYGANEYPPEKVGWHEGADFETPQATPSYPRKPSTAGPNTLDVSRLVTLPPPYPRHYPALNNKHPQLTDLRNEHRALADTSKIRAIRDAHKDQDYAMQTEQMNAAKERRTKLRSSIQAKVADGSISFAEAAQAEADFDLEEAERGKANARSNFDVFEANITHPLNTLISEKLEQANASIDQLRVELESRNEVSDPNQAQEEGDEEPERLEKLTLLKWLFEAREQLHKEMFDMHADRSAKYSEVILTPYRISNMQAKMDEATTFFAKDSQERQVNYAKACLKRFEELQQITEQNVSRGVEDQLSAFWDIAPGLLEVVQQIPMDMQTLEIQIPDQEFLENPSYNSHPLQYLYSLLQHAQKSAYQFIESQTNLLCLLHEVRTATTKCRLRLLEAERCAASPAGDGVLAKQEMKEARLVQEEFLIADLKEKVGEVERQWEEALGRGLEGVKGRVREWLERQGGLEEGFEE